MAINIVFMLTIILGLAMSLAHHFSKDFVNKLKHHHNKMLSFSAGVSITYLFMDLFPYFSDGSASIGRHLFFFVLGGFILLHLAEKYIYSHFYRNKLRRELALENAAVSFTYHFIVGIILVSFASTNPWEAMLFFIPVFLHTSFNPVTLMASKSPIIRIVLASSTLLGVLFSMFIFPSPSEFTLFALIGFIIGMLSYTVIRHSVPEGRNGRPAYLIFGLASYTAFQLLVAGIA